MAVLLKWTPPHPGKTQQPKVVSLSKAHSKIHLIKLVFHPSDQLVFPLSLSSDQHLILAAEEGIYTLNLNGSEATMELVRPLINTELLQCFVNSRKSQSRILKIFQRLIIGCEAFPSSLKELCCYRKLEKKKKSFWKRRWRSKQAVNKWISSPSLSVVSGEVYLGLHH